MSGQALSTGLYQGEYNCQDYKQHTKTTGARAKWLEPTWGHYHPCTAR